MKFLKSLLASFAIAATLLVPSFALAQTNPIGRGLDTAAANTGLSNPCSGQAVSSCISGIIGNIIGIILGFVEVILFLLFIYAGFLWMTAGGDPKQVQRAKDMLLNAVIGLIIIGLSYLLTSFIITQFTTTIAATPSGTTAAGTAPAPGGTCVTGTPGCP